MPNTSPDSVLRYDDRPDGVIDLHEPPGPPTGLVFLVHGGFWKQRYDRTHTRPMARALADAGYLVATPEYRRGPGCWPAAGEDLVAAYEHICRFVGPRLPGQRATPAVSTVGHSAGGQLALWLSTRVEVDRVVALAPVCDLREAIRLGLGDDAVVTMLGDVDPDEADPMKVLRPGTDTVIVHGVEDEDVPIELSRNLVAAHPWVALHEVPGDHFGPIDPTSEVWPAVLSAARTRGA